jgi:hypothetical protein
MPFLIVNEATLAGVVTSICRRVSYPAPTDVAASTDPKILQMIAAANAASSELWTDYEWSELIQQGTISVVQSVPNEAERAFDFPEDFYRFVNQTQWDGSMQFPALGPVSPQGWMTYLVLPITSVFTLTWQVRDGRVWFLNPPAVAVDFRFMYYSLATVIDGTDPTLFKNVATANTDEFRIEGALIEALARQKWLEWNGFDSEAAARDFSILYDARVGVQKAAPVLSATPRRGIHLIDAFNAPQTGYGL